MESFLSNVVIKVNEYLYLKDPESSDLGKKIVSGSIELIDEVGFEAFTFKKLAKRIESTEASIYRYFENKNKVLLYLTAWYWGWMESKLLLAITNIEDEEFKLRKAIKTLTKKVEEDGKIKHIDEAKLQHIIFSESAKAYLNKFVDNENEHGVYKKYKSIVQRISNIILSLNPDFPYPNMLVSTIIEGSHHQRFFSEHLPSLTNEANKKDYIETFFADMAINTVLNYNNKK